MFFRASVFCTCVFFYLNPLVLSLSFTAWQTLHHPSKPIPKVSFVMLSYFSKPKIISHFLCFYSTQYKPLSWLYHIVLRVYSAQQWTMHPHNHEFLHLEVMQKNVYWVKWSDKKRESRMIWLQTGKALNLDFIVKKRPQEGKRCLRMIKKISFGRAHWKF